MGDGERAGAGAGASGDSAELRLDATALESGHDDQGEYPAFSVDPQASWPDEPSRARPSRLHLHSLSNGLIITLVIAGPVLLLEANWRGAPLTRQPDGAWLLALLVVGGAFFAGGAVAGRHRRRRRGADYQGLALSGLACGALAIGGAFRQLMLLDGLPTPITIAWLILGAMAATVLAVAGSRLGRRWYIRSRRDRQL
jgi:uncharacterized membrane protein